MLDDPLLHLNWQITKCWPREHQRKSPGGCLASSAEAEGLFKSLSESHQTPGEGILNAPKGGWFMRALRSHAIHAVGQHLIQHRLDCSIGNAMKIVEICPEGKKGRNSMARGSSSLGLPYANMKNWAVQAAAILCRLPPQLYFFYSLLKNKPGLGGI